MNENLHAKIFYRHSIRESLKSIVVGLLENPVAAQFGVFHGIIAKRLTFFLGKKKNPCDKLSPSLTCKDNGGAEFNHQKNEK